MCACVCVCEREKEREREREREREEQSTSQNKLWSVIISYESHEACSCESIPHFYRFVSAARYQERSGGGASLLLVLQRYRNNYSLMMGSSHHKAFIIIRLIVVLTSIPHASATWGRVTSGAQFTHSTTCSCPRSSALHSFVDATHTRRVCKKLIE